MVEETQPMVVHVEKLQEHQNKSNSRKRLEMGTELYPGLATWEGTLLLGISVLTLQDI